MANVEYASSSQPPEHANPSALRERYEHLLAPHTPMAVLDAEGRLLYGTAAFRKLLEYPSHQRVPASFLTLVHSRHHVQVTRDVSDIAHHRKRQSFWLLRLQTGRGRWRWYKVSARTCEEPGILIVGLRDVYE